MQRRRSFLFILGNDNALAQSQTVRLDHRGIFSLFPYVSEGVSSIGKYLIFGRGNTILFHQAFGKHLAALNFSCFGIGTETGEPCYLQRIHHSRPQRVIRGNNYEINTFFFRKGKHSLLIHSVDRNTFRITGNTAVARCAVKFFHLGAFFQLAHDGMLSASASNY